ncbi:S-layer homology domain-containing protein [Candidatus Pseudoscillospira sp. SGI.172]|uniref:S-layer homology domain-containing protein n=1 Tax=Candidatus Pseudoscillospira sp. SGI.172 TaxID=3420582 RepID=UPI003D0464E5
MKKTAKKLLSMALVLVMVLSMLPAMAVPALAAETTSTGTKDDFGISTPEWTAEEKAAAEADLPFGTGYGTWTTLFEKNELFFSMGYDSATRLTGLFDWNGTEGTTVDTIVNAVDNFGQSKLTSKTESYKAVATAAMDLNGTGKKEYVANLALNTSNNALYLYVTDSSNNAVDATQFVEFKYVKQLSEMEVHQLNGAFSIAAGDFDGDGKDTIVVYIPRTDVSGYTKNGDAPFIAEYFFDHGSDGKWKMGQYSTVSSNVLTLLGNDEVDQITTMKNQPMVDLVAEDVDKDGFDELIVTAGMNDVTNSDHFLESHIFIYDQQKSGGSFTWNRSYDKRLAITSENNKRVVWASSTVGNIIVNTSTTSVDYPEIITAGFIDGEQSKTQHINVGGNDDVGVTAVQVKSVKNKATKNVICEYEEVLNQKLSPNSWTKGGFYESEDVNGLLQMQAYADRGLGKAESVFISGSVYRINSDNKLAEAYKHGDFDGKDDFAPGGRTLTNTTVTAVTAGNFDGNDEGREQLICVTTLKQSGKNNAYSRVYCYYAKDDDAGTCDSKRSNYLTEHKGNFYVSLAALDTDNDSVVAKLVSVERDYSAPDVLAILESAPYFDEIADSFGNSETTYGKATSSGNGSTNRFGFTLGVSVGYEFESDLIQSGGGFEIAVDNAFNWATANTTTVEWFTEFRNDSGDNLVVVYRCPVVTYRYVDLNGKELVVEKVGPPATSMITVDEYNEAAEQYDGLDPIDETNAKLGDAGDPASYRSSTQGLTNAVAFNGTAEEGKWDSSGWTQYYGSGSVMQGLTITEEQEKTFSYDLAVSKNIFVKVGGVTAGANYGFTYGYENTHISGKSVTKSGALTGQSVSADYDFRWKFAAWNCTLNGSTVPVLGYLVKDVEAPPSPAMGLTAESFTTDSVTLRWSSGIRPAEQYRIYRVRDTAPQYVLVGAVQGDQTSFTLTGLRPGETYTYVVRGVGYQADGTAVESVDSAPITVRTQSEDNNVTFTLRGSSLTADNILQSTGAEAVIHVEYEAVGTSTHQWQLLEAGNAGIRNGWLDVGALAGKTIGAVKGATSSSLTLQNIDKSLNGSRLRCVVTVTTTAGDVDTYYSPVATLDLSGLDTTTTIKVTGTNVPGSGSITDPYTGTADHTTVTQESSGSYMYVPETVTDGSGKEYTIYQDTENNAYVGVYDEVSDSGVSHTYRAVMKNTDGTYSLGDTLTLDAGQYLNAADDSVYDTTGYTGFDGVRVASNAMETVGDVTYVKMYAVDGTVLTEYWCSTTDGLYYIRTVSTEGAASFGKADPQPGSSADLRGVYYESDSVLILDAAELTGTDDDGNPIIVSSEYDRYAVYEKTDSGFTLNATIYRIPGTTLKNGGTAYADSAKLETVTVQKEVLNTVTTSQAGTQLTLFATVTPSSGGAVSFTITNTDTGAVTQFTTTSGTPITWTAPKAGLYRIVATTAATATTKSSSAVCYYRADDPTNDYRLTLWQGNQQVTNISYNGSPVSLVLEQRTNGTWGAVTSGVSYKVNGETITSANNSYTPGAAGSYTFSAQVDGKTVATAMLVVNKVSITVTPTWGSAEGATNTVPAYGDIKLAVTDAQGKPSSVSVADYMTVSCDLYQNGALDTSAQRGVYTVTPVYVNDTVKADFLSRYSVTLNTANIYYISGAITVYFSAGENGAVSARYIDPSGTEFSFNTGSQISMDYRLKFVASPNSGWSVDKWTVTVGSSPANTEWYSTYGNTLEFNETGMNEQIEVFVTFTDQTHQITYSHSDGGSLSATAGGSSLTSDASVAHNAAVTFTAKPDAGMMVEKWTVDGAEYKWDGTDALYRENTLTLENISAAHDVQVYFTDAATTNVTVSAEDTANSPYLGATITVTDAAGNTVTDLTAVPRSSALTFTVEIDNSTSAVVKEWQTSTDGTNWTTVTGSGGQDAITIYEHGETLYVRVVIAVSQTYQLSWNVAGLETGDDTKATLVVWSGNATLGGNGSYYAVNTPVEFSLQLDNSYYVIGWSENVTPAADGMSATMTLTDNTDVTVTVAKKPTVSWDASITGGTVSVTGTVNGETNATVNNGGYVDLGSNLAVTLSPAKGYEVSNSISAAYTDGTGNTTDDKTYTISDVQQDQTIEPVWTEIPTAVVSYSVVDKNGTDAGGMDGTLTVTVTRKNMSGYAVTDDNDGTETVCRDSVVTFTAEPDTGYKIGKWIVNGVEQSTAPTLTIDNTDARTVQVQFDPVGEAVTYGFDTDGVTNKASLSAVYQANGTTEKDNFPSGNKPTANGTITFMVSNLESGYEVEGWYVNGVKQDGQPGLTYTYSVTANVGADVEVKIIRSSYTVTFSDSVNGSISATVDGNSISSGDSIVGDTVVTFTASPVSPSGYTFAGWTVNGAASEETTESLTLPITENTVVKASYTQDVVRYTVTYDVIGENGTLSAPAIAADGKAAAGSRVVFTATPADGYRVAGWYSDAAGTTPIPGTTFEQNRYTIEDLLSDTVVYVKFDPIPTYDITVNVTGLGIVTATVNGETAEITNNKLTVTRYDDVVLTAAPDAYQYLTGWTLDGADQGNSSMTLTLTDVTEAHTVAADFAASQLVTFKTVCGENGTLTAKAGYSEPLSTIDASTGISLEKGNKVIVTASPNTGYMVKAWTVNGEVQDNLSNTLTIENLSEATTVTVEFEPLVLHTISNNGIGYTISGIVKTPGDYGADNEIRDRGTVTFTVKPDSENEYSTITQLKISDYDFVNGGTNGNVTVVKNADGSYTVTITGVTAAITTDIVAHKVVVGNLVVPDALKSNSNLDTVEKIQAKLETKLTGSKDNQVFYDIALKYYDGSKWVDVTEANFPANGVDVVLPYPDGTDSKDTFTIVHMLTTGENTGEMEIISYTKEDDGLHFHVTSLSPFGVSWVKYTAPTGGGGGGGGGAATAETVIIKDSLNGKVIVDSVYADEGDTVTLIVEPDKGYTLETLTVTDKSGNELKLKDMGNGKYTFTMPASKVTIKATFMEDNSMLNFFVDVPADAYYYDAVLWAAKEAITGGVDDTHFAPNATCTRAQAVTFLWRAAGCPAPKSHAMPFTDVAEGSYYHDAVLWAVENGITKGTSDTAFSPNATCTRAQIVTFLWRSQKSPASGSVNPFTDVAADAYYANAVLWAAENGITGGTTANTFSPANDCTRAQIVTFLYRCLGDK